MREVGAEGATRCCLFSGSCGAAATSFQLRVRLSLKAKRTKLLLSPQKSKLQQTATLTPTASRTASASLGNTLGAHSASIDKSKFQYMRAPQICICRPRAAVDLTVTATTTTATTATTATTTARTTNNAKWPKTCDGNANPKTNQQTNYAKAQSIHTSNNSNNNSK